MNFKKKYIGDRAFYRMLFALILPLIIQQGLTNLASLADNLMVGALGTTPMSSVAIANQLIFVFNMTIFGGVSGASIFGAQFAGASDWKGQREVFRFKLLFCTAATVIAFVVFYFFGDALILRFFDNEANRGMDMDVVLRYARDYLDIILIGIFPFALIQAYAGTLRENGETLVPMLAGAVAIAFNMTFNWLLIFGKCGFPMLGVRGAAIATTVSRFIELGVIMLYTHLNGKRFQFIRGAYRSMHIPAQLVRDIAVTGAPLMLNEVLWSLAMTFVTGCYAARGMNAVAAANITTTVWNLFCIIMFAMGAAISIVVGRELGCGNRERAMDMNRKLMFVTLVIHLVMGALLIAFSGLIPELYNTEPEVRATAARMLMFGGLAMPFESLVHASYFAIRSGGKTWTTFAFDCGFSWLVTAPIAWALCTFTAVPVEIIYLAVRFADVMKLCIAFYLLKKGSWANTIIPTAE